MQFEMAPTFRKARGAGAFQMGTPSILALAGLEGALGVFEEVTIADVRQRSLALTDYLIALADTHLPECSVKTPRDPRARGAHVALEHPEAHLLSLALRARHIIPDYRAPNLLRLAPVALYNTEAELEQTVAALQELLRSGAHRAFRAAGGVT